jgi:hypothetical protein
MPWRRGFLVVVYTTVVGSIYPTNAASKTATVNMVGRKDTWLRSIAANVETVCNGGQETRRSLNTLHVAGH